MNESERIDVPKSVCTATSALVKIFLLIVNACITAKLQSKAYSGYYVEYEKGDAHA